MCWTSGSRGGLVFGARGQGWVQQPSISLEAGPRNDFYPFVPSYATPHNPRLPHGPRSYTCTYMHSRTLLNMRYTDILFLSHFLPPLFRSYSYRISSPLSILVSLLSLILSSSLALSSSLHHLSLLLFLSFSLSLWSTYVTPKRERVSNSVFSFLFLVRNLPGTWPRLQPPPPPTQTLVSSASFRPASAFCIISFSQKYADANPRGLIRALPSLPL